jgi:hypothetical protein
MSAFPSGEHDDQVDTTSQALLRLTAINSFAVWDKAAKQIIERRQQSSIEVNNG